MADSIFPIKKTSIPDLDLRVVFTVLQSADVKICQVSNFLMFENSVDVYQDEDALVLLAIAAFKHILVMSVVDLLVLIFISF